MFELKLEGMTCEHCTRTVKEAILSVDPESRPDINLAAGTAQVDTNRDILSVSKAIENEGYSVVSVREI